MNNFKIPSPNELKLAIDDYKEVLYKDRDPLMPCIFCSDSDIEDDFTLENITTVQRDRIQDIIKFQPQSRLTKTDHAKVEPSKADTLNSNVVKTRDTPVYGGRTTVTAREPDNHDADEAYISAKVDDPITLKWLENNFECHPDYSIPRGDMFHMFARYCMEHGITMMCNQATFGKSVRAIFPSLKTRRIGVRGQSRYHYDGVRPKMNSYVSDKLIPRKNVSVKLQVDWNEYKNDSHQPERQEIEFGSNFPSDHLLTILIPGFPTMRHVHVNGSIQDEMSMFLMLYRCYAVDILKTIIKTRFTQLEGLTSAFWKNLPTEISKILTDKDALQVIRICDTMTYSCVIKLLIPSVLVPIPTGMIRLLEKTFGPAFVSQHNTALSSCPTMLQKQSVEDVIHFSKKLTERLKLCYLCGIARETLQCGETTYSIRNMIKRLDSKHVADCVTIPMHGADHKSLHERIENGIYDFQQLLAEKAKFDKYICWLKSLVVDAMNFSRRKGDNSEDTARVIVLELSYITGIIAREITFDASESVLRAFHDVEVFFISYVKFLLETEHVNKLN